MPKETYPLSHITHNYPNNYAIAFCTDAKYWPHVATAVKSIFVNSPLPLPDIYIFYEQQNLRWIKKLTRLAKTYQQSIFFRHFGLDLINGLGIDNRYGPASYIRIYLPELLMDYGYILYLDSDLIVTSDISSIFSFCQTGSSCIAARSALKVELIFHNQRLSRPLDIRYFNSGVLLIDTVRWRERNCTETVMNILRNNLDLCIFPDQDALNLFFNGNYQELPYQYNVTRRFYEDHADFNYPGEEQDIKAAAIAPTILHFSGTSKPWNLQDKHPFKQKYRDLRQTFHWYPYTFYMSFAESILLYQPLFKKVVQMLSKIRKLSFGSRN